MPLRMASHLLRGGVVAQAEDRVKPEFISGREIFEGHVGDLPVWNTDGGSVESSDLGRPEADFPDRSQHVTYFQCVSHAH